MNEPQICQRCREEPARVWITYRGRRFKVCGFCEMDVAINGW